MSIDISQYKIGIVLSIEDCGNCKKGGKVLRSLKIRIGESEDEDCVAVVTSANNVRENSRVVVALAGSSILNDEGEMQEVKKASVGGAVSEGMLLDSHMLGWKGGAKGIAVNLPDSFEIGSSPPSTKPRGGNQSENTHEAIAAAPGLFAKKLTKEEKKKLSEEKKKARKAAKAAKEAEENAD
mmetsp:Transcript_9010/g.9890  ORF Transcript_9010/g.9890 Transcript_9010/m.9890 type:complete len:182 (-) Transcript_9010:78-623(-)